MFIKQNFNIFESKKMDLFSETEIFTYPLHKIDRNHARGMRIFQNQSENIFRLHKFMYECQIIKLLLS